MHFRSHLRRREWIPHGGYLWAERSIGWFQEDFDGHIENESTDFGGIHVCCEGI